MSWERTEKFIELNRLEKLCDQIESHKVGRVEKLATINTKKRQFPIYGIVMGPDDPTLPTLGIFGGVHGLEKVGTHLVLYYLKSIYAQLKWDGHLQERFKKMRLVSIPLINPGGMSEMSRANPRGVDLMRNAPVEADDPAWMVGGHRISSTLPWYRGDQNEMEVENQALVNFVKAEMFHSKTALSIDCHSGFGAKDQLWYPYAKTKSPFPLRKEAETISKLLKLSYYYHVYKVEPQSLAYTTHGDVWDYLFDLHHLENQSKDKVYIPWTLEMGSWIWLKKNPMQLFSSLGPFNPIRPHRYKRIMRRHHTLLDFFSRVTLERDAWIKPPK